VKIIQEYPPNFKAIDEAFHVYGKPVIYAYGNCVYNPKNVEIHPALMEHETVHCIRQNQTSVDEWWEKYIANPSFRLAEEVLAHRAEYLWQCRGVPRQRRRQLLKTTAARLAHPLYGKLVTVKEAKLLLEPD